MQGDKILASMPPYNNSTIFHPQKTCISENKTQVSVGSQFMNMLQY